MKSDSPEAYKAKIDDLHTQLEKKSKELNSVQAEYDRLSGVIVNEEQRLSVVKNDIVKAEEKLAGLASEIDNHKQDLSRTATLKKEEIFKLDEEIEKKKNDEVLKSKAEEELAGLNVKIEEAKESVKCCEKDACELDKKLLTKKGELQKTEERIIELEANDSDRVADLVEREEKLKLDTELFAKARKNLAFYARRLERVYKAKGAALPSDIIETIDNLK